MAEYIMKDLVKKSGLEGSFQIASAATSREEIGNPVYPPARRKLAEHGISCGGHAARQLRNRDYEEYDLLIGMDKANLHNMFRICGGDFNNKMHLLLEYAGRPDQEVMDQVCALMAAVLLRSCQKAKRASGVLAIKPSPLTLVQRSITRPTASSSAVLSLPTMSPTITILG